MSLPPPPGFGIFAETHRPLAGTKGAANVYGFRNGGSATAAACLSLMSAALHGTGAVMDVSLRSDEWELTDQYCLVNIGGALTSFTQAVNQTGTMTADVVGPATSVVINKLTALAGRQYRGRVAMPAAYLEEGDVNGAGIIAPTPLGLLQSGWDDAVNFAATSNVPFYLLHGPNKLGVTPIPTIISSFSVSNLTGSQRKRLR